MTENQKQVRDWMQKFGQETPEKPVIPSLEIRRLRAKLILEEAIETIHALGISATVCGLGLGDAKLEEDLDYYKPDLTLIADGCEDLKVVTEGTLVACGLVAKDSLLDQDPLFDEVMKKNEAKFWTQEEIGKIYPTPKDCENVIFTKYERGIGRNIIVKNRDGKVLKSPSWTPPNLEPIIRALENSSP